MLASFLNCNAHTVINVIILMLIRIYQSCNIPTQVYITSRLKAFSYTFLPALVLICPKMLEMCRASNAESIHWVLNHDVTDTTDIIPPKREVATSHVCYWQQSAIMNWHGFNASFYSMHKTCLHPSMESCCKQMWSTGGHYNPICTGLAGLNINTWKCQTHPTKEQ